MDTNPYGAYVKSLTYRLTISGGATYEAPEIQFECPEAHYRLSGDTLFVTMKVDYPSPPEAQAAIELTLRSWEANADLTYSPGEFRFSPTNEYEIGHRTLPPNTIVLGTAHFHSSGGSVTAMGTVTPPIRKEFPAPPIHFRATPNVQTMMDRYLGSNAGREPIASMAYFSFTMIRSLAGPDPDPRPKGWSRNSVSAKMLSTDPEVLTALSRLSSTHGGALGRKASAVIPLSGSEAYWIQEAIKALIIRFGEYEAGAAPSRLSMADLPPL